MSPEDILRKHDGLNHFMPPDKKKRRAVVKILIVIALLVGSYLLWGHYAWGKEPTVIQGAFCDTPDTMKALLKDPASSPKLKGKSACANLMALVDSQVKVGEYTKGDVLWSILKVHLIAVNLRGQILSVDITQYIASRLAGQHV